MKLKYMIAIIFPQLLGASEIDVCSNDHHKVVDTTKDTVVLKDSAGSNEDLTVIT